MVAISNETSARAGLRLGGWGRAVHAAIAATIAAAAMLALWVYARIDMSDDVAGHLDPAGLVHIGALAGIAGLGLYAIVRGTARAAVAFAIAAPALWIVQMFAFLGLGDGQGFDVGAPLPGEELLGAVPIVLAVNLILATVLATCGRRAEPRGARRSAITARRTGRRRP